MNQTTSKVEGKVTISLERLHGMIQISAIEQNEIY